MIVHKQRENDALVAKSVLPSGALVTMKGPKANSTKPTSLKLENENNSGDWYDWGDSNDWPTQARKKVEASSTAYPLLFKAVSIIFGEGVTYYFEEKVNGKKNIVFKDAPEIDKFFEENDIDLFYLEQLMDYKFFGNQFQEFIFNDLCTKIIGIYHKEAEFSRLSKQNETTLKIEKLGYSGDWDSSDIKPINLISGKRINREEILKLAKRSGKKLANHSCFPSPGRTYYAMPPHGALYKDNSWLDFSNKLSAIMNSMVDNQMTLKYHIEIPYDYWPSIYQDWDTWNDKKRHAKIDEKLNDMDEWLRGADNVAKSFISHFATNKVTGDPLPGWKITPIDDKLKKDEWIPGTQEADQQIARSLNIDPSMAGIQAAGGKLGAGSGSDKRTAFLNAVAISKAEQKILFQPLEIVKKVNGWPSNVRFAFAHQVPTTLDKNPTGTQKEI